MSIFKLTALCLFVSFFSTFGFAQKKGDFDKWLEIKVFISTRDDVKKKYGNGESGSNPYFVIYKTANGTVSVEYSAGGCKTEYPLWNMAEWTVTEITYRPWDNPPKLKNLISDKSEYKSRQSGDVTNHIEYYSDEKGISIIYDKESKKVISIELHPSLADKQKYTCRN